MTYPLLQGQPILFYTIYRTTNLLNGKFYIGKHQTKNLDDGYFGSGKLLIRAVKKHGIQNFVTEIIAVYKTEREMNLAERILVVMDSEISYNLCSGGQGGFGFINKNGLRTFDLNARPVDKLKESRSKGGFLGSHFTWFGPGNELRRKRISEASSGRTHSAATKEKIAAAKRGRSNKHGKPPWNKGLTKKTDARLAKLSETNSKKFIRE